MRVDEEEKTSNAHLAAQGIRRPYARTIALVGFDGLVVVEANDALLVVPRGQAQDAQRVVDALKARGRRWADVSARRGVARRSGAR
ncbi:hypothetical protein [Sorangium sp. So ce1000]|uniref:hypothetical protein n=1 Tax=Sorangium sp. So ce1000 TaxID=3133325 RepID=UPI003F5EAB22